MRDCAIATSQKYVSLAIAGFTKADGFVLGTVHVHRLEYVLQAAASVPLSSSSGFDAGDIFRERVLLTATV